MPPADQHRFVFVGGLHRSGTSLVARSLTEHPSVSGFRDTGVPEDEGVHLQDVYRGYGGWGRFGFDPRSHFTEHSPLVSDEARARLLAQWGRHWDLRKPVLLEKSPANLLKARFLQALFPRSWFVMVIRHPAVVAAATQRWTRPVLPGAVDARPLLRTADRAARRVAAWLTGPSLVRHWIVCHETLAGDLPCVRRIAIVRYEDLVCDPEAELARLHSFIDLELRSTEVAVRSGLNEHHLRRWRGGGWNLVKRLHSATIAARYEARINRFGYSFGDSRTVARGARDANELLVRADPGSRALRPERLPSTRR